MLEAVEQLGNSQASGDINAPKFLSKTYQNMSMPFLSEEVTLMENTLQSC